MYFLPSIKKRELRNIVFFIIFLSSILFFTLENNHFLFLAHADELTEARQRELQAELDKVLKEIEEQTVILGAERQKGASLERDLAILNAQISQAKLKIRAHTLAIEGLGKDIGKKNATIKDLNERIERNKESLAELMRKTNEIDSYSLVEVALSNSNLSEFFSDLDSFQSIEGSVQTKVGEIKQNKNKNETEKALLNKKQLEEIDAKVSVEGEKRKIEVAEAEKKKLLAVSKQQQTGYAAVLAERQAKAASIRSALFALRDTAAIPFGKALEYANIASKATGVRPAFILAILTQESNLGQNVGSCYVTNMQTGGGVKVTTGAAVATIMKPDRDIQPFIRIMEALGRDPKQSLVSCPFQVGYGGAMGPSQFIPSTWETYQKRIAAVVGKTVADPWDPKDAITATSLFLKDLGAGAGTYTTEREAAGRYYAGAGWATRGLVYADSVLKHAKTIQETMIDPLQGL